MTHQVHDHTIYWDVIILLKIIMGEIGYDWYMTHINSEFRDVKHSRKLKLRGYFSNEYFWYPPNFWREHDFMIFLFACQ